MSRELDKQLKNWGREVRRVMDARDNGSKERIRAKLMEAISDPAREVQPATRLDYYFWTFNEYISGPVTVGAAMLIIAFGGWMTTVNAADSLPGEALYSVKLATEKAQLKLASLEHKAVLHTEFAERRLNEVVALEEGGKEDNGLYIKEAMVAYQKQVTQAGDELNKLREGGSLDTIEVASKVDQKITELNESIEETVPEELASAEVIEDAHVISEAVADSAVDVMVEEHAIENSEMSAKDLESTFRQKLIDTRNKQTYTLGRLVVVRTVLGEDDKAIAIGVRELEFSTNEVAGFIANSMNYAASGGYRDAFDILREANDRLSAVEDRIVDIEITLSTVPQIEVEESEPISEELETDETLEVINNSDLTNN